MFAAFGETQHVFFVPFQERIEGVLFISCQGKIVRKKVVSFLHNIATVFLHMCIIGYEGLVVAWISTGKPVVLSYVRFADNAIRYARVNAAKQISEAAEVKANHKKLLSHVMWDLESLQLKDDISDVPSREKAKLWAELVALIPLKKLKPRV